MHTCGKELKSRMLMLVADTMLQVDEGAIGLSE